MDVDRLLRAVAANHRAWFRRLSRSAGGRIERFSGCEVTIAGASATIPFPSRRSDLDGAAALIYRLRLREAGCWALHDDPVLTARLVARGFGFGWQPHWMALDLRAGRLDEPDRQVEAGDRAEHRHLPYGSPHLAGMPGIEHFVVRERGEVVGEAVLNVWRGSAGIYNVGVAQHARRRGIGRALSLAALRRGRERGCSHAVLNATGEGLGLYESLGFASLGFGRTWWLAARSAPGARDVRLAEAIGLGDVGTLERLRPGPDDPARELPAGISPLALAVVTGRVDSAAWILDRRPDLVSAPIEPRGGTLLHCAVEWDDRGLAELALRRGADLGARDRAYRETPLEWAERLGRTELREVLRARTAR